MFGGLKPSEGSEVSLCGSEMLNDCRITPAFYFVFMNKDNRERESRRDIIREEEERVFRANIIL